MSCSLNSKQLVVVPLTLGVVLQKPIPDCDELFARFFDRWYDDDWRQWKGFPATRPDILEADDLVGRTGADASPLGPDGQSEVNGMIRTIYEAAESDWGRQLDLTPPVDIKWVEAIDAHYDRGRIREMINDSDPEDFSNTYVVTCCEFGAVLGYVLRDHCPELEWLYGWPYWESALLHPPSGSVIPVFHWAIKKMSEYGVDDGFAEKIAACSQMLRDREQRT